MVPRRIGAILALTALVLGGLLLSLLLRGQPEEPVAPVRVEETATVVEDEPAAPPEEPSYGLPVRLEIPSIGVDAPVVPVGLTPDGNMESPEGPEPTGWYELGARPGERGSAVIAGHSGYRTGPAVFDDLKELGEGDLIYVIDDEGERIVFRVRENRQYGRDERPAEVFSSDSGGRYLNLITCTGTWDSAAGTREKRLVVFAEAVDATGNPSDNHSAD